MVGVREMAVRPVFSSRPNRAFQNPRRGVDLRTTGWRHSNARLIRLVLFSPAGDCPEPRSSCGFTGLWRRRSANLEKIAWSVGNDEACLPVDGSQWLTWYGV